MPVGRTLEVGSLHLGPTGSVLTFNQSALPQGGQLGQIFETGGKFFRLVQFSTGAGTVASIDGGVAYWKTKSSYLVTDDASDGEALAAGIAGGIQLAAVTTLNYIFIQCGGDQAAVVVAASAVAGDLLSGHASTDNVLTRTAAGSTCPDVFAAICLSTRGTTTSDNGASVANSSKVRWRFGALL